MNKYKRTCGSCSVDFISNSPYKKYCSRDCKLEKLKSKYTFRQCGQCGSDVRVYPNGYNKDSKHVFCNNKCQGNWVSENESEERAQRASHMREFRDNEEAWKKGLETRKENGNIITEHSWKQYWKKCDYLTRKLRKQMIQDWDGYDYIDGEYIRENLDLHYSHKRYPTLDHVVPRSECFKQGLTPEEATQPSNLKWTTRINNSKKHNRV